MDAEKEENQSSGTTTPPSEPSSNSSGQHADEKGSLAESQNTRTLTGIKWFLFNLSTLTSIFLYALDNTIVANIQPAIVNEFNAIAQLPWLSVGFMIGGVALAMPIGKLYSLYDAKWIFIISTVIFMAASALCGAAPNMTAEIIGRVAAGASGNSMYYGLLHLMSMNTTDRERPIYLNLTGATWGLGTVLGPVIGGAFELVTWRWAFYINLLFAVFLLPAYFFLIPSNVPKTGADLTILQRLRGFDFVGATLSVSGYVILIVAMNFGGILFPWDAGSTIALFVVSGCSWIAFAVQQTFCLFTTQEQRMFPVSLLKYKEVILLFVCTSCMAAVSYTTVYYIPLYFQFTRGDSAIQTAVRMLPYIMFLIALMMASGFLMSRLGYYKPWYVFGSVCALVGSVLMSRVGVNTSNAANYGFQILIGFGSGSCAQAGFAVVQAVIPKKVSGDGVTIILISQLTGITLGLSLAGALFINLSESRLHTALPGFSVDEIEQIVAGTSGDVIESLSAVQRQMSLEAIVSAGQTVFTAVYAAAALSLLSSIFLSNRRAFIPTAAGGG